MNKFYVTKDVAENLRSKGYYREYDVTDDWVEGIFYQVEDGTFHLPRIDEVLAWLREEKKIHIGISPQWQYTVYDMRCNPWIGRSDMQNYDDYTKAAIAGIEYCLDNLI